MARSEREKTTRGTATPARPGRRWARMSGEHLLDVRLCDLDLQIEATPLAGHIARLYDEMAHRRLAFRPHFWLSDDWFTPDGVSGSGIPFYVAHPRLMRLERAMMGEVEGGTAAWCLRILRHEAGHAIDHAYRLYRRRTWQRLFGLASRHYPRAYRPNPYSRAYVQHLEYWYAQSHPAEDFAETFAVWLAPRSAWRKRYAGWPAIRKLEYVDGLMREIGADPPPFLNRARSFALPRLHKTLREHYDERRATYANEYPDFYDADLLLLFSAQRQFRERESAAAFIRRTRAEVLRGIFPWLGGHRYVMGHVLKEMIGRARRLRLHLRFDERRTIRHLTVVLTKHCIEAVYKNRRWVEL
jgi:hypothetical protein